MNKRLRAFFFLIFLLYISLHFLIPQGSHLHLCWQTLEYKLCTLDEENHQINHIFHHQFHDERLETEHTTGVAKKRSEDEKLVYLTFLSSGDKQNMQNIMPHQDFVPSYFVFSAFLITFSSIPANPKRFSTIIYPTSLTSRSPPKI
jgi:hypothetical protein